MSEAFKDLFSEQASDYARFRPQYPSALFRFLAEKSPSRELAIDCGSGNGQAALGLAEFFRSVLATEPSAKQLREAIPHPRVCYRLAAAESSGLPDGSADLITVAQAFHWFRQEAFFREVSRIARPGALLALWCYELCFITPELDALVMELYRDVLDPYWDPGRRLVEQGYRQEKIPFEELAPPRIEMSAQWGFADLVGYLGTWSALAKYRQQHGEDPRIALLPRFQRAWGSASALRQVRWPLSLRWFRVG